MKSEIMKKQLHKNSRHFFKKVSGIVDIMAESIFRRIRINQRLLITFILLSAVPLCIIGFISIQSSTKAMEENIGGYSIQLLTQVANNVTNETKKLEALTMEIMESDEMRAFDDSMRGKDENSRLQAMKSLESLFDSKVWGNEDIASIAFYPQNYDMVAKTEVLIDRTNTARDSIFSRALDANGKPFWIYMKNKETELGIDTDAEFSGSLPLRIQTPVLFRKMSSFYDTQTLGVLHVAPKKQVLQEIVTDVDIGKDGSVMLLDSQNKVISSKESSILGNTVYPEISSKLKSLTEKSGYFFVKVSKVQMLVCYSVLDDTGWRVLSMIPFRNLTTRINQITVFVFALIVICILIALIVSYLVTRSVSLPISRINDTVECLGRGDFSRKLDIKFGDELSNFSSGFNKMIDDMQNLISEVYLAKIEKLDSDFKALQAQINPHFLYNTLESINSLALIKHEMEISEMIRGLAAVFRYSTKNNSASVQLKDEIEHVRLYILLQALRYDDRIEVEMNIPESLLHAKVLKFMLQPLVENAIVHGLEKANRRGLIKVEAYILGQELYITVADNGRGMDEEQLGSIRTRLEDKGKSASEPSRGVNSIGLTNIHARIRLQYGEGYGLSIKSVPDGGTVVGIKVPLVIDSQNSTVN